MADSAVPITPGSGANIDTYQIAGGDHQQIVREARATAITTNTWTVSTTASASQIAADAGRLTVVMVSLASARVYLRFDATAPTAAAHHWYLDPGDRYEVPPELATLAISMLGQSAGGTILTTLATAS
ncbi:hypothetical protein [Nonomuraea sp. SYSU D8015]|uniref:hypothetical protein n=1 Tax=Nonomuraea sp. SYSU D8015 TaxID=2593644 RepID=UPI00166009F3|nr:hypothetical protein [Nonomuraea sp. SYSU D8015]